MLISKNKVVSLAYELKNDKGETLDVADSRAPFHYLHGASQIVPGLESALDGLKKGDKKSVTVKPDDGYGEHNPELKMAASKTQFPGDVDLQVGLQFETETDDGERLMFTITGIEGDKVIIDGNHPLAGQTLHFSVEVIGIREATKDELQHGHAHGDDGHHVH